MKTGYKSGIDKKSLQSEAYLEGMKTFLCTQQRMCTDQSEAYLEGMKTPLSNAGLFFAGPSEAYLEGMKTCKYILRRKDSLRWSEAYLEGMKTHLRTCSLSCTF